MKSKKLVLAIASLLAAGFVGSNASAQVRDVSVVVSPYASYNWWNSNIALENAPFWGARVGFGFGPFFELRANYEQSINLKNALQDKEWNPFNDDALQKLDGMDVTVSRFGGEAKVNLLGNYAVTPYLTAGAGVQIMDYNPFDIEDATADAIIDEAKIKDKQLYYTFGAGVKLNITDRMAFSLEARNLGFNMNANNAFLDHYGEMANEDKKLHGNWSALASFDFYLGGNTAAGSNELSDRYASLFSDGFRGMKFVLEPSVQYIDFRDKTGIDNQWFLGGSAGVDFSSLVGLRVFYYQATQKPDELSFDFNKDMKMYGANFIARLNYPRGIVPYLRFGAGYLDRDNLIAAGDKEEAEERFSSKDLFGLLGAGVEVPISRWFALFGNVDAMLMTANDMEVKDVSTPEDIATNISYSAGIRINLGDPVLQSELTYSQETDQYNERTNELRSANEESSADMQPANTLVGRRQRMQQKQQDLPSQMMTKKEFEEMIDRIMARIHEEESKRASLYTADETDVILRALSTQSTGTTTAYATPATPVSDDQAIRDLQARVGSLERDARNSDKGTTTPSTTIIAPGSGAAPTPYPVMPSSNGTYTGSNSATAAQPTAGVSAKGEWLQLNRLAVVTGVNLGESASWGIGIRGYLQISDSNFDFMPELMFGFRDGGSALDLGANFVYNFDLHSDLKPYAGAGVGISQHGQGTHFGTNLIVGTNYKISKNGELFVDYIARNLFKNNQIAVGYRFIF